MALPQIPLACYRLQFNRDFTFRHAADALNYLSRLGITDVYASPLLQSRSGSQHGYDVTDPSRINGELGEEQQFEAFQAALQKERMGLLLDIVPNHMAASSENPWWMDVLENGPGSSYAAYFETELFRFAITTCRFRWRRRPIARFSNIGNTFSSRNLVPNRAPFRSIWESSRRWHRFESGNP